MPTKSLRFQHKKELRKKKKYKNAVRIGLEILPFKPQRLHPNSVYKRVAFSRTPIIIKFLSAISSVPCSLLKFSINRRSPNVVDPIDWLDNEGGSGGGSSCPRRGRGRKGRRCFCARRGRRLLKDAD